VSVFAVVITAGGEGGAGIGAVVVGVTGVVSDETAVGNGVDNLFFLGLPVVTKYKHK